MASVERWKGNRWRARYRAPDGKSHGQVFDRKLDAERFLVSIEHSKLSGAYIDAGAGRVTVKDYIEGTWAPSRVRRASTAERHESYLGVHVLPHLGHRPIGAVRNSEVQGWVRTLSLTLAPGTVENIYRLLGGIFRSAVRDRVIAVSPCEDIALPKRTRTEVVPPTGEEVAKLLSAMPDNYRILGLLAAGAGLRQGEALGLTADRIDFLRRKLTVDRQLVTLDGQQPHLAPPKTEASARTVPLGDVVLDALAEHLRRFPPGEDGLLVTYGDGRPVRRNRFGAMWRQSVARADLETPFRYHDLRHHFASVLIAAGCSVKAVQKALGHASAKETLDCYSHMWPDAEELTRAAVDAALAAAVSPACHGEAESG